MKWSAGWLIPIPESCGLNPVISSLHLNFMYYVHTALKRIKKIKRVKGLFKKCQTFELGKSLQPIL